MAKTFRNWLNKDQSSINKDDSPADRSNSPRKVAFKLSTLQLLDGPTEIEISSESS